MRSDGAGGFIEDWSNAWGTDGPDREWVPLAEAASRLGITVQDALARAQSGDLPAEMVDGWWHVPARVVRAGEEARHASAAGDTLRVDVDGGAEHYQLLPADAHVPWVKP